MPRLERNTEMRGRAAVPMTLARTRRRRRSRCWGLVLTVTSSSRARSDPVGDDPTCAGSLRRLGCSGGASRALAHLPGDVLALVADALALVGLRRALLADVRGDLADELLRDPLHDDARRLRDLELDAVRRLDRHRVRVAERELEVAALEHGAVAHALDLEALLEAGRHALDHVRHERAGEAVERAVLGAVGRARDDELAVVLRDVDVARHALGELAARAADPHELWLDRDQHAVGDRDGLSADSGHARLPDVGDDLAADARVAGLVAGHDAVGGGHDCRPHAAEDLRDLRVVHVAALARARYALQAGDGGAAIALRVLERDADQVAGTVAAGGLDLVGVDVALLAQDPRHLDLELVRRDLDRLVRRLDGVAHAGEEVGDGVGHGHASNGSCYQLLFVMPGM